MWRGKKMLCEIYVFWFKFVVKIYYVFVFKLRVGFIWEYMNMFKFGILVWNKYLKYFVYEDSNSFFVMIFVISYENLGFVGFLVLIIIDSLNGNRENGYLFLVLVCCLNFILLLVCIIFWEVNLYYCFICLKMFDFVFKVFWLLFFDINMF